MSARRQHERLAAVMRRAHPGYWRHLPPVHVEVDGPWIPGWLLTIAAIGAALIPARIVAADRGQWILLVVIIVFVVANPDGMAPGVFAVAVGSLYLLGHPVPFSGPVHLLVALVPSTLALSCLVPGVPWRTKVEIAIFRAPLVRVLVVQGIAQPLVIVGRIVVDSGTVVAWMPAAAAVGVAIGAWWFHRQLRDA